MMSHHHPWLSQITDIRVTHKHYAHLKKEELPCAESLKDTLNRVFPHWMEAIVPKLITGKKVLVSAHGNSLPALIKFLSA